MAHIYNLSQWFRENSISDCYYIGHETTLMKMLKRYAFTLQTYIQNCMRCSLFYFVSFHLPYVEVPERVWLVLNPFASQGLLNWVQNWRHLPVPVFYYMAKSPFEEVCLRVCLSQIYWQGIDPLSTCWHLALTSVLGVRTVFRQSTGPSNSDGNAPKMPRWYHPNYIWNYYWFGQFKDKMYWKWFKVLYVSQSGGKYSHI